MKTKTLFLTLFLFATTILRAQIVEDSISYVDKTTKFNPGQLILPASLIVTGSWGICNGWIQSVNHSIHDKMTDLRKDNFFHADDYIQYLPVVSYVALGSLGVKSKHSLKERLAVTATSYLALGIMVNTVKWTVNVRRPDSSARNSFPSGHTATVFMGAELIRKEYGTGYGVGAYSIAFGVAFLRLYNDRHWFNDVVAGAGVGILSARIGYWMLPLNRKLFRLNNKNSLVITTLPYYDPRYQAMGGALAVCF